MIWALEAVKTSRRHSHYRCYFISNMRSWGNGVWRSSSRQIRKVTRRRVTFSFSLDVSLSAFPWTLPPVFSSKFGSRFSFFHTYQGPKAYQKLSFQKKHPFVSTSRPRCAGPCLGGSWAARNAAWLMFARLLLELPRCGVPWNPRGNLLCRRHTSTC